MKIATAGSRSSKRWRTQEITWDSLIARLREPLRTGETFAEYQRMDKDEKDKKKGAAGGFVGGAMSGGRRVAGAVTERWLITLDADDASDGDWENASCLWDHALCAYTTHSHSPDRPRLRWLIPLRRGVSREEYEPLARKAAEQLGILHTLDPSTYQPERLMYWPTAARDGEYRFLLQDGPLLDPDELLREYGPDSAWKDVSGWPIGDREREVVRRATRQQADPTGKPGLVGLFCRTYDVPAAIDAFLPEVYVPAGQGRYTYAQGTTSAGAVLYGDGLWLYSNHASDPAWGQLCNAFDLVRLHKFGELDAGHEAQETNRRPSYKAMCEWASGLAEVRRALARERSEAVKRDFADLAETCAEEHTDGAGARAGARAETGEEPGEEAEGDGGSWADQLAVNHKTGEADPTIANARLIMEHDPVLAGAFAVNEFTGHPVLRRSVPWDRQEATDPLNGRLWTDADDSSLREYMERTWHMKGRTQIQDAWNIVVKANSYHPVREYLEGLTWDGAERLDTMLIRWMGAPDSEFVRAATRKWMCAAVARIFDPGHQFDNMLVLIGPQGVGKSRLARALSRGWFSDSLTTMTGKEAYEGVRGVWIVELAELAAAKRSETETIKNFITKREDSFRPAYGKHTVVCKRQCVFYGTTNDPAFLKDKTGNRRYWPVTVTGLEQGQLIGLEQEIDQLWAEALTRWRGGESLWMDTASLRAGAEQAQEEATMEDDLEGMIQRYLDTPLPDNWEELDIPARRDYIAGNSLVSEAACTRRRDLVSIPEVRAELLGETAKDCAMRDTTSRRVGEILTHLPGWTRTGARAYRGPYGRQRVYARAGLPA